MTVKGLPGLGWIAIVVLSVTCLSSALAQPATSDVLARGLVVYQAAYCGTCHTLSAAGAQGRFGPSHDRLAETIEARLEDGSYSGDAKTIADYLRESILAPDAYLDPAYVGSRYRMPAFTDLSPEDVDALVKLLERP